MTIYVVCLSKHHFDYFCRHVEDHNPRSPDVVCITTSSGEVLERLRGRRKKEGDRLVFYGPYFNHPPSMIGIISEIRRYLYVIGFDVDVEAEFVF